MPRAAALADAESLDEAYRQDLIAKMDSLQLIEGDFCTGCGYCKECEQDFNLTKLVTPGYRDGRGAGREAKGHG